MQIESDPNPILVDRAGRMLEVPPDATGDWTQSLTLVWDAWSRIVQISQNGDVLGAYAYDGLTRRITRAVSGATWHCYYSDKWRSLEERLDEQTTAAAQYLWGARHRDDLVRRDRATSSGGPLDETRYVLTDYFSPASITDPTGAVTERYAFTAFGVRTILTPGFSPTVSSESAWKFAFQGQFLDSESGLLNYGYRFYSPYIGRWLNRDPLESLSDAPSRYELSRAHGLEPDLAYQAATALPSGIDYAMVLNNPLSNYDVFGLTCVKYNSPQGVFASNIRAHNFTKGAETGTLTFTILCCQSLPNLLSYQLGWNGFGAPPGPTLHGNTFPASWNTISLTSATQSSGIVAYTIVIRVTTSSSLQYYNPLDPDKDVNDVYIQGTCCDAQGPANRIPGLVP